MRCRRFLFALALLVPLATSLAPSRFAAADVSVREADDYVFGNYRGEFVSPPSADNNPRRAVVVEWPDRPYRFVFTHEGSYCPWFELPGGAGVCFQFFEGNDGWAELFNQFGRMEKNSFVEILDRGPRQVHVRWTYFGVNQDSGERAYRAVEDFYCLPNGLVLRRQGYETLMPGDHRGYAREPIELIGMCPVGRTWRDVLRQTTDAGEHHALAAMDPFSDKRYDVYWKPRPDSLIDATARRDGCDWRTIDDAAGVVLVLPMRGGSVFCAFGAASGFEPKLTRIKEHSHADTGGIGWVASSWDHWPIGWLNSQAHVVDAESLKKYPNHFSPAGMDLFAMANADVAKGAYWSLMGVEGDDIEAARRVARAWLELADGSRDPKRVAALPAMDR